MGREIYDSRGNYLGEVINLNRLMANVEKETWRGNVFTPAATKGSVVRQPSKEEQSICADHQDFPDAASFSPPMTWCRSQEPAAYDRVAREISDSTRASTRPTTRAASPQTRSRLGRLGS